MQRMCSARTTRCRRQTQRSPRLRSRNPSAGSWPQRTRSPGRYSLGDLSDPLLIVDGDSIVFRAWFALPASIKGSDGRPVNALLGAANLILRAVEDHEPRAVVVCFGQEAAHYRVELFDGYHAQRPELDPDLAHQYEKVAGFFESFGWTVATHDALEADDLLASYAAVESERGGSALIMTGDRDMFQCAGDRVTVLYVSTGKNMQLIGTDEVRERYGVEPSQVPDFIALRGDPSDGIPGAKGIGAKTAAELLRAHGSLEDTMRWAVREGKPSLQKSLLDDPDRLLGFKLIATVQLVDVDPPPDTPLDGDRASAAAADLGMNALAKRLAG